MLQVISKRIPLRKDLIVSSVRAVQTTVRVADEAEYQKAIPFEKMPRPKALPFIGVAHHFMPGGQFFNKNMKEMQMQLKDAYGDVVFFKGTFGQPDFVFLFNVKDHEMIFRTEGKWPIRQVFEVLDAFRANERPDLFQGIGGLLQE